MLAIIVIILLIDIYTFKGVKLLSNNISSQKLKTIIFTGFWIITGVFILALIIAFNVRPTERNAKIFSNYSFLAGLLILFYIPKIFFLIFHFTEDLSKLISLLINKLIPKEPSVRSQNTNKISRYKFLSQAGLILAAIPFILITYGMIKGRFNFRLSYENLKFNNLPKSFNGLKIVHISDIHIGSFYGFQKKVKEAIDLINAQEPDLILFTGDLVNIFTEELDGWLPILKKMKARIGKYSILGNHDYGDYYNWESDEAKKDNLNRLILAYKEIGFHLLLNESVTIAQNGQKIAIIGVENWGYPPFAQYGDFSKAHEEVKNIPFKILLSHDPSHWDAEIMGKTNVDLTLSGHTHGMQFGIKIAGIKWSPIKLKYPRWGGLYQENNQFLYVNTGLGYIGFPGRVGIPPEITVIKLVN